MRPGELSALIVRSAAVEFVHSEPIIADPTWVSWVEVIVRCLLARVVGCSPHGAGCMRAPWWRWRGDNTRLKFTLSARGVPSHREALVSHCFMVGTLRGAGAKSARPRAAPKDANRALVLLQATGRGGAGGQAACENSAADCALATAIRSCIEWVERPETRACGA